MRNLGVPESTTVSKMEDYVERLLKDLFPDAPFTPLFSVERAHRTLGPRHPPATPARPILARQFNFKDRDLVLRLARERGNMGNTIALYPDFTLIVQTAKGFRPSLATPETI